MKTETVELGVSVQGRVLKGQVFTPPSEQISSKLLLLGGVHGDEIEGVWLIEEAVSRWLASYPYQQVQLLAWSRVNPDGVFLKQRCNAQQVDLNRNLPTQDWTAEVKNPRYPPGPHAASEPENKALIRLLEQYQPTAILSMHSFSQYQVNANGPSLEWAQCLANVCGYPVTQDIGYPTPGSLGTYAGKERNIPTITLEIERGLDRDQVLKLHLPVVKAAVDFLEFRKNKEE